MRTSLAGRQYDIGIPTASDDANILLFGFAAGDGREER
jgi:hypothetical protein